MPHKLLRLRDDSIPPGCEVFKLGAAEIDPASLDKPIRILPFGNYRTTKGDFIVDEESKTLILAQFDERGVDMVIDYEHQTSEGMEAPAAGWITRLYAEADGIYGEVKWNPRAREYLKNREYRYLSPSIWVRQSDMKIIAISTVALTNLPATLNAIPIAAKDVKIKLAQGGTVMKDLIQKLIEILARPFADAKEEHLSEMETLVVSLKGAKGKDIAKEDIVALADGVLARLKEFVAAQASREGMVALKDIAGLVGLSDNASMSTVKGTILALKNPTGVVNREEFESLQNRLQERDAQELVAVGLKQGKITPAMEEWARNLATEDPKAFKVFLAAQPEVVPLNKRPGNELVEDPAGGAASEVRLSVQSMLGIDEKTFKEFGPKAATQEA